MTLASIAILIRLIIIVGAVLFAFALLFFGFHIVLREYKKLNTWAKMRKFLELTSQAGLQADAAKGTLALSRTTPGIILIGIGTAILGFCILQKFEYTSSQEAAANTTGRSLGPGNPLEFEQQIGDALQRLNQRVTQLENTVANDTARKQIKASFSMLPVFFRQQNNMRNTLVNFTNRVPESIRYSRRVVDGVQPNLLDQWLTSVPDIKGKKVTEQIDFLLKRYGDVEVKFSRILTDRAKTTSEIATEEYGHARYAPLLESFNPRLPTDGSKVPLYSFVAVYYPATVSPGKYRQSVTLRISGMSRAQVYDRVLSIVNGILASEDYRKNPTAWWNTRFPQLGAVEFARSLNEETGRQWGVRTIQPDGGDNPELLARITYGDRKYVNILKFLNYHHPKLFKNNKTALPIKTDIVILQLIEL